MAKDKITKVFNPTITLDAMQISDKEYGTDRNASKDNRYNQSKALGNTSPFIQINEMRFSGDMILSMDINCNNFLPSIRVTVKDMGGVFSSNHYPKDGDLISVLVKSNNEEFKTLRADFRILGSRGMPSGGSQGSRNIHTLDGILNIPGMHDEFCKSFGDMTSLAALQEIAKNLNLGFASNEDGSMTDSMTWIQPFDTNMKFIKDITMHAYKDDTSFYTCHIDPWYYLTFVEVNSLLVLDRTLDTIKTTFTADNDIEYTTDELKKEEVSFFLSNANVTDGSPQQITGYIPINNSGNVSLRNSYRRVLQYYFKDEKEFQQYFIETMNTDGADDKVILKGRADQDHTQHQKYKYLGSQPNSNVHANYQHAKIQNYQNLKELIKLGMKVELAQINPVINKFLIVPIFIINKGNQMRTELTKNPDELQSESEGSGTMDSFLSGFYLVDGMNYVWHSSDKSFKQTITCYKREFDAPARDDEKGQDQ